MRTHAQQTTGSAYQPDTTGVDLQAENPNFLGQRERTTKGLLIVFVTAVAEGATLTIVAQDSLDAVTYDADYATLAAISATGVYICQLRDLQRVLRLLATVTGNISWGAIMVGFDATRRPVYQVDATSVTVTYGSGR